MSARDPREHRPEHHVREVVAVMLKLGTIAFGGPAVHVALLRDEAVRRRQWLDDEEFLDLFGAVSVLPGPSSTQLAIVLSRRRAGWAGLVIGGACFIAPAMAIVLVLAWAYVHYGTTPTGGGVLYGVEPVVVAIVAVALWELAREALKRWWFVLIGAMAVTGYFAGVNVLIPLLAGGGIVMLVDNRRIAGGAHAWVPLLPALPTVTATPVRPGVVDVLAEFTKLGVVVFGSGYVLLAFLRADLVDHLHWLSEQQVLDAVTAGQITPGPVFTTATFVGYLLGGVPLALAATAGIFVPSFFMAAALVLRERLEGSAVALLAPLGDVGGVEALASQQCAPLGAVRRVVLREDVELVASAIGAPLRPLRDLGVGDVVHRPSIGARAEQTVGWWWSSGNLFFPALWVNDYRRAGASPDVDREGSAYATAGGRMRQPHDRLCPRLISSPAMRVNLAGTRYQHGCLSRRA